MIRRFDFHKGRNNKEQAKMKANDSHWDELEELELEEKDAEVVTTLDDEIQKLLDKLEMTQEEFIEQFPTLTECLAGEVEEVEEVKAEDSDDLIADYEHRIAEAKRTGDTEAKYYYQDLLDELLRDRYRGGFEVEDDPKSKLENGYVIFINNNDGYAALVPRDKMDDETEYLELELEEAEELIEKYELAQLEQSDQSQNTEVYGFENKAEDSEDDDEVVFVVDFIYDDYTIEIYEKNDGTFVWSAEYIGEDRTRSNFNVLVASRDINLSLHDDQGHDTLQEVKAAARKQVAHERAKWDDQNFFAEDALEYQVGDKVEVRQYGEVLEGEIVRPVKKSEVEPGLNNPDAGQYYLVKTGNEEIGYSESVIWEGRLKLITKADEEANLNDLEAPAKGLEVIGYQLIEDEDDVLVYESSKAGIRIDNVNGEIFKYFLVDNEDSEFTDEELEILDSLGYDLVTE